MAKKQDSWSNPVTTKDFIARKTMDYTTFTHGTTIPQRYHEDFLKVCNEDHLPRGKNISVKLIIDGKKYDAKIYNKDRKAVSSDTIQVIFNTNKQLLEVLRTKLDSSYEYLIQNKDPNSKKSVEVPEDLHEYMDFYKGPEPCTFIVKLISKNTEDEEDNSDEVNEETQEYETPQDINESITHIHNYIKQKGFTYDLNLIRNLYISLKTKPFTILTGISGTGKSKIAELFTEAIGATFENNGFTLIPVRPDWSDATDLLGYRNIESKFTPGSITTIAYEAMKNPEKPYFICLDEMNLARVEYYFSDILSLIETRKRNEDGNIVTEKLLSKEQFSVDIKAFDSYGDVYIPENLYIIGTVNMDETTFPFSKKVLDRANTIEFNEVDLSFNFEEDILEGLEPKSYHNDFLKSSFIKIMDCKNHKEIAAKVINKLIEINKILEKYDAHFGYRVRDEIVFYCIYALENDLLTFDNAIDYCIIQKVLPKISGSSIEVQTMLMELFNNLNPSNKIPMNDYIEEEELKKVEKNLNESTYILSSKKIIYMIRRFVKDGFTTFWR